MKVETKVTVLGWLLVTCAAAASVLGGAEEGDRATPQPVPSVADVEREIAVVRLGEFRLTVTAARESDEDAMPTATVHLTADEQVDGAWVPIDREQVGEPRGWFW